MSNHLAEQLACERFQLALPPFLNKLKRVLELDGGPMCLGLFTPIEEIRTINHSLEQVGFTEDALHLRHTWVVLHTWLVGSVMNEVLASIADDNPEQGPRLPQLLGDFPSVKELDTSLKERRCRDRQHLLLARQLLNQLQQALAVLAAVADPSLLLGQSSSDDSAFVPAASLLKPEGFPPSYRELNQSLKDNSWIRRQRPISARTGQPIPNRLSVHAGDWHKFLEHRRQTTPNPLDLPAEEADALLTLVRGIENRKCEIRRNKLAN